MDVYGKISAVPQTDGTEVMRHDQMLWDHQDHFKFRWEVFKGIRQAIDNQENGIDKFSQGTHTATFNFGMIQISFFVFGRIQLLWI